MDGGSVGVAVCLTYVVFFLIELGAPLRFIAFMVFFLYFSMSLSRMMSSRTGRAAMLGAGLLTGAGLVKSQLNTQKLAARNWSSPAGLKFPAAANYPDLKGHNNVMASHLTPDVRYYVVESS